MRSFRVDPEALRAMAATLDGVGDGADDAQAIARVADAGHARLEAAIGVFAEQVDARWRRMLSDTREAAAALRRSADQYEAADADGAELVRSGTAPW